MSSEHPEHLPCRMQDFVNRTLTPPLQGLCYSSSGLDIKVGDALRGCQMQSAHGILYAALASTRSLVVIAYVRDSPLLRARLRVCRRQGSKHEKYEVVNKASRTCRSRHLNFNLATHSANTSDHPSR